MKLYVLSVTIIAWPQTAVILFEKVIKDVGNTLMVRLVSHIAACYAVTPDSETQQRLLLCYQDTIQNQFT